MVDRREILTGTEARFVLVGVANTVFGLVTFAVLEIWWGSAVPYLAILVIAHVVNVTEAFLAQKVLVFRSPGSWWADYARFWIVQLASLALNAALLPLLVEVVGLDVLLAQSLVVALIAVASFFVHQRFTFRGVTPVTKPSNQVPA